MNDNLPSGLAFYLDYKKNKNKPIPAINLESLPNHSFLSLYYGDKKNTMPKLKRTSKEKLTFCVSACNNLNYLKLLIYSVRKYAYYKTAPFIVFAEHCIDGTNECANMAATEKLNG